jgi:hypothetical protein
VPHEIEQFPFIVLELVTTERLGVRVYDQQQIEVKPEWRPAVASSQASVTLAQCIRKVCDKEERDVIWECVYAFVCVWMLS